MENIDNNDDITRNHQPPSYSQPPQTETNNPPMEQENELLQKYWSEQMQEIEAVEDFKTHQLPLARIKKIMKSDPDVRMISAEAPVLFAKACEMFTVDLTMRSWLHAEENKRRTLQKSDISAAVARTFTLDFLLDIIPRDDSLAVDPGFMSMPHHPEGGVPFYYPPGVVTGTPAVDGSEMYAAAAWPGAWTAAAGDGEDEAGQSGGNSGENSGGK